MWDMQTAATTIPTSRTEPLSNGMSSMILSSEISQSMTLQNKLLEENTADMMPKKRSRTLTCSSISEKRSETPRRSHRPSLKKFFKIR